MARSLPRADEPYEGYESYYHYHLDEKYRCKRDLLGTALKDVGFAITDYDATPGGGFSYSHESHRVEEGVAMERLELPFCANPAAPGGTARLD